MELKKYKVYPEYKDSGVEWIGEIPEGWEVKKVAHTTYVKGRIGWQNLRSEEFSKTGFLCITGTDFKNGEIDFKNAYRVSEERYREDPYIQLKNNDLLITKDGTIGKLAITKNLKEKATLNSGIFVTRPYNDCYSQKFLFYILSSKIFEQFINFQCAGTTINHLYQYVFMKFKYPLSPLNEQQQIATFLDHKTTRIDQLIQEKQELIELLKKKKTALITKCVTKGLDDSVKMKDSGVEWIGEIPEGWEVKKLKYILSEPLRYGANDSGSPEKNDNDIRLIRISDIDKKNNLIDNNKKYLPMSKARPYLLFKGDILFARSGATVGKTFLYKKESTPCCFAGYFIKGKINKNSTNYNFVNYYTKSYCYWHSVNSIFIQATIQNVSAEKYKDFILPIPPLNEQHQIATFLDRKTAQIDQTIQETEESIELLKKYKTSLITNAVTGKIDVRDWTPESQNHKESAHAES